jgi:hypothetical protein
MLEGGDDELFGEDRRVLSEIEKFRLRQAQRDKVVEAQRKERLRERIILLKQRQEVERQASERKQAELAAANALAAQEQELVKSLRNAEVLIKNKSNQTAASSSVAAGSSKQVDDEELRRKRKLQVLGMLQDDNPSVASAAQTGATASSSVSGVKLDMKASKKGSFVSNATAGFKESEEDVAPKRQVVPMEFTEEERRKAAEYRAAGGGDEGGMALAQLQAQAISAAVSGNSKDRDLSEDERRKNRQRRIADQIPTEKLALVNNISSSAWCNFIHSVCFLVCLSCGLGCCRETSNYRKCTQVLGRS